MKKVVLGGFAFVGGAIMYSVGTLGFAHVEVQAGYMAEDAIIGRITSTVSLTQWPEEDGQANFDGLDSPYAMTSDGFVVLLNNEWTLFELREEME